MVEECRKKQKHEQHGNFFEEKSKNILVYNTIKKGIEKTEERILKIIFNPKNTKTGMRELLGIYMKYHSKS
jgi:hypothetical protein